MTTLTLNFNEKETEIINEYIKANNINIQDLQNILINFLSVEKYNNKTIKAIEEAENIINGKVPAKTYNNFLEVMESLGI